MNKRHKNTKYKIFVWKWKRQLGGKIKGKDKFTTSVFRKDKLSDVSTNFSSL